MELDTDQDRLVSFQEMKTALLKKDPKEIQRAELENTFRKMDKDGSGRLSREEVKQQCIAMGIKMSDEGLENLIKKADKNNDGNIDIDEFMLAWQGA
ncbi:hypothetical protein C0Q70_09341 [Pomacea canaliculata]|uniref:EF-hand domain-containing protein n=2 Tax=Pomacea canaliculata TaxID=400727 RepID=A0A2T7P9J1_POMCA|nr:hypothetical protein C0Q70_09341 [Pomacea canaliculata]